MPKDNRWSPGVMLVASNILDVIECTLEMASERPTIAKTLGTITKNDSTALPAPEALIDRETLATVLGVSVATVDRLVRAGAPYEHVGGRRRFRLGAVNEWRAKRGRVVFKANNNSRTDVSDIAARAGLRVLNRASHGK